MYIKRDISKELNDAAEQFPVVFLTGPRQSGKTTLLKTLFPEYTYTNCKIRLKTDSDSGRNRTPILF